MSTGPELSGVWDQGVPCGVCRFDMGDGDVFEGPWEGGVRHGVGTRTTCFGATAVVRYERGRMSEWQWVAFHDDETDGDTLSTTDTSP